MNNFGLKYYNDNAVNAKIGTENWKQIYYNLQQYKRDRNIVELNIVRHSENCKELLKTETRSEEKITWNTKKPQLLVNKIALCNGNTDGEIT